MSTTGRRTAISGSWRNQSELIETDVRLETAKLLLNGDTIITGGALGVDYFAADTALERERQGITLEVIIPVTYRLYVAHYFDRANQGIISKRLAMDLESQLDRIVASPNAKLVELPYNHVTQESYYARNTAILERSDHLVAFQLDHSPGTQDTIDKAKIRTIPVRIFAYSTLHDGTVTRVSSDPDATAC